MNITIQRYYPPYSPYRSVYNYIVRDVDSGERETVSTDWAFIARIEIWLAVRHLKKLEKIRLKVSQNLSV